MKEPPATELRGRLAVPPEIRQMDGGTRIVLFHLVPDGKEEAFGAILGVAPTSEGAKIADEIGKLTTGDRIALRGTWQLTQWKGPDGESRQSWNFKALTAGRDRAESDVAETSRGTSAEGPTAGHSSRPGEAERRQRMPTLREMSESFMRGLRRAQGRYAGDTRAPDYDPVPDRPPSYGVKKQPATPHRDNETAEAEERREPSNKTTTMVRGRTIAATEDMGSGVLLMAVQESEGWKNTAHVLVDTTKLNMPPPVIKAILEMEQGTVIEARGYWQKAQTRTGWALPATHVQATSVSEAWKTAGVPEPVKPPVRQRPSRDQNGDEAQAY
jgi:single-stranded DNA-binding protein